jgi:MFS family permease
MTENVIDKALGASTSENEDTTIVTTAEARDALGHSTMAYGPNGVRGIFSSGYVFGAAFLASLGGFSFGYDQGVISIINVMDQFHTAFPQTETAFGIGFMTGMLLLGAFVGCLFMPYLADKVSRKWALTIVVVIFDIGAIIQTGAQSYGMLVAGRAIGGIGVGTLAMVFYLLIFLCLCRLELLTCLLDGAPLYFRDLATKPPWNIAST